MNTQLPILKNIDESTMFLSASLISTGLRQQGRSPYLFSELDQHVHDVRKHENGHTGKRDHVHAYQHYSGIKHYEFFRDITSPGFDVVEEQTERKQQQSKVKIPERGEGLEVRSAAQERGLESAAANPKEQPPGKSSKLFTESERGYPVQGVNYAYGHYYFSVCDFHMVVLFDVDISLRDRRRI